MVMQRIFSSRQVGKLLGADPSSVNRWIDSGKLKAYRTPGGHRRVLFDDLMAFLDDCGIPVPDELKPDHITLLLVDDDQAYIKSLRKSLLRADKSLEITTCTSGYEALIELGAKRPDAVVLDVFMPGMDGVEVCSKIKGNAETQNIMVIATTAHPSPAVEKKVLEAGASAFLAKPFKATAIVEAVRPKKAGRA